MNEIGILILAAGESKRMGRPKMLLPFMGTTVIENIVEQALNSRVGKTVVVTGCYHSDIEVLLNGKDVGLILNRNFRDGMLSSVRCGLECFMNEAEAVAVVPGDNIWLTSEIIAGVIKQWRSSGKGIAVPVSDGKRGHPLVITGRYFGEVMTMPEEEGLRRLLRMHPEDIASIEGFNDAILKDIDTYEDYLREINIS